MFCAPPTGSLDPEAALFPSVPRSVERDDKELKLRGAAPPPKLRCSRPTFGVPGLQTQRFRGQDASGEEQQKVELKRACSLALKQFTSGRTSPLEERGELNAPLAKKGKETLQEDRGKRVIYDLS